MGTSDLGLCWWCHAPLQDASPYRGTDPIVAPPSGVVVCTPACPSRPDEATVWRRGDEISADVAAYGPVTVPISVPVQRQLLDAGELIEHPAQIELQLFDDSDRGSTARASQHRGRLL